MQQNKNYKTTWRTITILLFITGIVLVLSTIPSYITLINFLGRFQPDGSFDSLSNDVYNVLIWISRIKGGVLILAGLYSVFNEKTVCRLLNKLDGIFKNISIKREMKLLLSSTCEPGDKWILLTLGILTMIGLFTRLIQYNRTAGYDEAYTFIHFASRSFRTIITDYSAPNNHIFHSLLVHLVYLVFGSHLWALRLPALIAGVVTIPSAYLAARTFYGRHTGLLAAALVSLAPMLVDYSNNARGYTMMCVFACLLLWLAGFLRHTSTFTGWVLLSITSALGFYTLPVMVYPVSVVFLWLLLCWLVRDINKNHPRNFIISFIISGVFTIILTILLYSPVLILGTGLSSITSNEFVQSQNWSDFFQSVQARSSRVWQEWNVLVPGWITGFTVVGFGTLIILEWRNFKHKVPIWFASFAAISVLLLVQRVAPWPRVWLFLLVFYLIWSAAGWIGLIKVIFAKISWKPLQAIWLSFLIVAVFSGYLAYRNDPHFSTVEENLTKEIAIYISENITEEDTLVAVSPFSIQVGYYLSTVGIPFDRFYDRARKGVIKHAIVIVAERSKFPTMESVLAFQQLEGVLDIKQAQMVHQYKRIHVYNVPVLR